MSQRCFLDLVFGLFSFVVFLGFFTLGSTSCIWLLGLFPLRGCVSVNLLKLPGRNRDISVTTVFSTSAQELRFRVSIHKLRNKCCQALMKKDVLIGLEYPGNHQEKQLCLQGCLMSACPFPCSPCPLPRPPLEEEAGLLPGYNYQEGELPKPDLAAVCGLRAAGRGI